MCRQRPEPRALGPDRGHEPDVSEEPLETGCVEKEHVRTDGEGRDDDRMLHVDADDRGVGCRQHQHTVGRESARERSHERVRVIDVLQHLRPEHDVEHLT